MHQPRTLIIKLPEPCEENWDKMKPNGCSRFCGQCEKTVIDFTEMTDEEVVRIMTKAVSTPCGRFKETQLNRVMLIPEEKKPIKPFLQLISKIAASILLLQAVFLNSFGQKQTKTPTAQTAHQSSTTKKFPIPKASTKPLHKSTVIKGSVFDGASFTNPKEGLIGASVKLAGKDISTPTDIDGNFEIELPQGATDMLEISYQGYETQTVKAVDRMEITLNKAENILIAVTITTSCGPPVSKQGYVGMADVVTAKKIANTPVFDNTDSSNTSQSIRMGGVGSLTADNRPLIILDGTPYKGDITSIYPADIIKMESLTDAMATSLYGAKGANGVIIITTKNAKTKSNFWNLFKKKSKE